MTNRIAVNADEITFGIEIECHLNSQKMQRAGIVIGGYHSGRQLPAPFGRGWNAQRDGSLSGGPAGWTSVEIVSPPLRGLDGIVELVAAIDYLRDELEMKIDRSCGVHVHIGMNSVLGRFANDMDQVSRWVKNVLKLTSQYENAIYGIVNNDARVNNGYCRSVKRYNKTLVDGKMTMTEISRESTRVGRYNVVNLRNLFNRSGAARTIEFRVFGPTTNSSKIVGYVLVAAAIAQRAAEVAWALPFDNNTLVDGSLDNLNGFYRVMNWVGGARSRNSRWGHRCGVATGVWEQFGKDVVKNQRWNADRFATRNAQREVRVSGYVNSSW